MEQLDTLLEIVEKVVDDCMFRQTYTFKMYEYLKNNNFKKNEVASFIASSAAINISQTVDDLDLFLEGGNQFIREAYSGYTKPEARKARDYLYSILEDAWKYEIEKSVRKRRKTINK
jgi:hypothetical protein